MILDLATSIGAQIIRASSTHLWFGFWSIYINIILTPKLTKHLMYIYLAHMFRAFVKLQQADGSFSMTGSRKVKENFYMRFGEEKLGPASNNQMHQTKQHSKTLMKIKGPHQSHHLLVTLPLWMKTSDSRRRMGCWTLSSQVWKGSARNFLIWLPNIHHMQKRRKRMKGQCCLEWD